MSEIDQNTTIQQDEPTPDSLISAYENAEDYHAKLEAMEGEMDDAQYIASEMETNADVLDNYTDIEESDVRSAMENYNRLLRRLDLQEVAIRDTDLTTAKKQASTSLKQTAKKIIASMIAWCKKVVATVIHYIGEADKFDNLTISAIKRMKSKIIKLIEQDKAHARRIAYENPVFAHFFQADEILDVERIYKSMAARNFELSNNTGIFNPEFVKNIGNIMKSEDSDDTIVKTHGRAMLTALPMNRDGNNTTCSGPYDLVAEIQKDGITMQDAVNDPDSFVQYLRSLKFSVGRKFQNKKIVQTLALPEGRSLLSFIDSVLTLIPKEKNRRKELYEVQKAIIHVEKDLEHFHSNDTDGKRMRIASAYLHAFTSQVVGMERAITRVHCLANKHIAGYISWCYMGYHMPA